MSGFFYQALDRDAGKNGLVNYKLLNSSSTDFILHGTTGELNSIGPLDFEASPNAFYLEIIAFDNGEPRRNATGILQVVVQVCLIIFCDLMRKI